MLAHGYHGLRVLEKPGSNPLAGESIYGPSQASIFQPPVHQSDESGTRNSWDSCPWTVTSTESNSDFEETQLDALEQGSLDAFAAQQPRLDRLARNLGLQWSDLALLHYEGLLCRRLEEFATRLAYEDTSPIANDLSYNTVTHLRTVAASIIRYRYEKSSGIPRTDSNNSPGPDPFSDMGFSEGSGVREFPDADVDNEFDPFFGVKFSNKVPDVRFMKDYEMSKVWVSETPGLEERLGTPAAGSHLYRPAGDVPEVQKRQAKPPSVQTTLKRATAYKWLQRTVRRDLQVLTSEKAEMVMNDHRERILSHLINDGSTSYSLGPSSQASLGLVWPPVTYTTTFMVPWNIKKFLTSEGHSDEDHADVVDQVLTLTGASNSVQALSCRQYLQQTWPVTGKAFADLLKIVVKIPSEGGYVKVSFPDKTRVTVFVYTDGTVNFEIQGTKFGIAETAEQLLWASTALFTPTDGDNRAFSLNTMSIHRRSTQTAMVADASRRDPQPARVDFVLKRRRDDQNANWNLVDTDRYGNCWMQLFRHCAIVRGYPVRSKPPFQLGLEVSIEIMAALAGADRVTKYGNNLVIKGFSSLFFATKSSLSWELENCVIWHYIKNDDGSWISFADKRIPRDKNHLAAIRDLTPESVRNARHFVGWLEQARSNAGAACVDYNAIRPSNLDRPGRGWVLDRLQFSAGQYISLAVSVARGKRDKPLSSPSSDYTRRLQTIGNHFFVLHDVDPDIRRAWLVDGLSALLHLVRRYLSLNTQDPDFQGVPHLAQDEVEPRGGRAGRKAAFETLLCQRNMDLEVFGSDMARDFTAHRSQTEPYRVKDLVTNILHLLEQIISHQADDRPEESMFRRLTKLRMLRAEGFDFTDVAKDTRYIESRTTDLHSSAGAWMRFANAIQAPILFGRRFGELWEPEPLDDKLHASLKCTACHRNCPAPTGRDILAVSVADLERLVERSGDRFNTGWNLVDDIFLDDPALLFSGCEVGDQGSCQTPERIQTLKRRRHMPETDRLGPTAGANLPVISKGALLIGKLRAPRPRFRRTASQPRQEQVRSVPIVLGKVDESRAGSENLDTVGRVAQLDPASGALSATTRISDFNTSHRVSLNVQGGMATRSS